MNGSGSTFITAKLVFPTETKTVKGELRWSDDPTSLNNDTRGWRYCFKTDDKFDLDDKFEVVSANENEFTLESPIWIEEDVWCELKVTYEIDLGKSLNSLFPGTFYKCNKCNLGFTRNENMNKKIKEMLPEIQFEKCECGETRLSQDY